MSPPKWAQPVGLLSKCFGGGWDTLPPLEACPTLLHPKGPSLLFFKASNKAWQLFGKGHRLQMRKGACHTGRLLSPVIDVGSVPWCGECADYDGGFVLGGHL